MYDITALTLGALMRMGIEPDYWEDGLVSFHHGEWPCLCEKCSPYSMRMMVYFYNSYQDYQWASGGLRLEVNMAISDYSLDNEEFFHESEGTLYLLMDVTPPYGLDPLEQTVLQMERFFSVSLPRAKKYIEGIPRLRDALGQHTHWGWTTPQEKISRMDCWTEVGPYSEGLAAVADHQGRYGYLNADVEVTIPCRWAHAGLFSEGLAAVKDADGRYGYIDRDGVVAIPCEWSYAATFSDGMAAVASTSGYMGFIDTYGRLVIPCEWFLVDDFHDGMVEVWTSNFNRYTLDRQGHVIDNRPVSA